MEYANAIRDLFGIEINAASLLPPDQQAYGFDTIAAALSVTPGLMERFMTAGAHIARLAIGDPSVPAGFERYTALPGGSEKTLLWQTDRLGEEFPFGSRGGIAVRHYFPVDGEYVIKIRLDRTYTGLVRGLNTLNQVDVRLDGAQLARFSVGGRTPARGRGGRGRGRGAAPAPADAATATAPVPSPLPPPPGAEQYGSEDLQRADEALEVRVSVKAGNKDVLATIVKNTSAAPEGLGPDHMPIWSHTYDGDTNAPAGIAAILIGGPYNGRRPETGARQRIFVCDPHGNLAERQQLACVTKILSTLARRAYRRPVVNEDIQTLLGFYQEAKAQSGVDAGIRSALERMLVDPEFLFRIEREPSGTQAATYRVADVDLSSRLSFFLWSSIPDDELLDVAIRGKLKEPAVLEQQVRRMLADPRAHRALADNFFLQWLQVRNVWRLSPDTTKYPWFDDNLRVAFITETKLFVESQVAEDRSILDLLTADYTFVNDRLAKHYGIPNVNGSQFRRVTLSDENRRGLLGQASVLAVTSYPNRTAPTIRGKWLLDTLLASPMPPPPANVDTSLKAELENGKPTTMREAMEQHRSNPVCASCHARMDPLGFGLENFDAIGQWRVTDAEKAIDSSGVLPDGTKFHGPAELRKALLERREQFVAAVVKKLMTYGVGRNMEYYDEPAVRQVLRETAVDNYRWSSVILAVARSMPLQMRRTRS